MLALRPTSHLDAHAAHDVPLSPSIAKSPSATPSPSAAPRGIEIDSVRLLQGQRELCIRHGDEYYRLRHTRNDKLILTK
ncbi:MAG: hemin uptake protein HemP [Luteimonas sp.]